MNPMSATAIILAAGASRRMGSPKALLQLNSKTLVTHHIDRFLAYSQRVIVVTGCDGEQIAEVVGRTAQCIHNPHWDTTEPIDSLLLALAGCDDTALWITPVDTPPASPQLLDAMWSAGAPCVPLFEGQPGHPVLIGPDERARLISCPPSQGLKALISTFQHVVTQEPQVTLNFNEPKSWATFLAEQARP
jgi:CTP:molybdopterin cytidylyltransferase MocA